LAELAHIVAILVADVVGYSRLAGADEDRTLSRLRALRSKANERARVVADARGTRHVERRR
jgi:class 3 adenylate cyclase